MKKAAIFIALLAACAAQAEGLHYGWGSLESLEKAAREGKPAAQADLGQYYLLAEEYGQALPWLQKAAKRGDAEGLYGLGFCYETGYCGKDTDIKKAAKYYKKAARKNSPGGLYRTALFLHDGTAMKADPKKALEYMRRAAEKGNMDARLFLASAYFEGNTDGIKQDYKEAAKYWKMLAEADNARACFNLGYLYYYGYGVPQDYRRAFEWDLRAAQLGLPEGQYQTGMAYLRGEGVAVDGVKGLQWVEKAAGQGYAPAAELMETADYYVYIGPDVGEESPGRAGSVIDLKKRAEAGEASAQFLYASLCKNVLRKQGDPCDAEFWYRKAAAQGLEAAKAELKEP